MIQQLAEQVWSSEAFQTAARDIELAALQAELRPDGAAFDLDPALGRKALQAAAILAASDDRKHRRAAYRIATSAYSVFGAAKHPFDQALHVVLARLGNFPAHGTDPRVAAAGGVLPISLAIEDAEARDRNRVQLGSRDLELTNFQHELWSRLTRGQQVAVSAPTSAGKSFVLQAFLTNQFVGEGPRSVVYIVPTRALISQVGADVADQVAATEGAADVQVITVPPDDETPLPKRAIYVMTQERVQLCLSMHDGFAADLVVVDEAHNIAEGGRGILLQWVVDDLLVRNEQAQVLFASPLVRNLELFQQLFGLKNFEAMPSAEATVSQSFISIAVLPGKAGRIRLISLGDGEAEPRPLAELELGQALASRRDRLVHIPARLGSGKLNIVYANGAAEAEKVALQLADFFRGREPTPEQVALAELVREAVHEEYGLAYCLRRGIAFHYANIPTVVRRAVEEAAANGVVDYIVCTSTLLQGVNLPAKNIFMLAPTKGQGRPLQSTDFWNLAGRAGRLRREFQGNIFLIAYEEWPQKPLEGPKDAVLVSALEQALVGDRDNLLSVVVDDKSRDDPDLETAFGRLFADLQEGRLSTTLMRAGLNPSDLQAMTTAIGSAVAVTSLPSAVVRQTPSISAHKQQRLFDELLQCLKTGGEAQAAFLIPRHPRDGYAFESYQAILERCHRILLGLDGKKLHRFHAMMAVQWMRGTPLPQIIGSQLDRGGARADRAKIIRDTLEVIESAIRFQTVRLFGCYAALLVQALKQTGYERLVPSVPAVALYLEVGASDRTMISLMSLGLSRVTAHRLSEAAADKSMDVAATRTWLSEAPLNAFGLSILLQEEVRRAIRAEAA